MIVFAQGVVGNLVFAVGEPLGGAIVERHADDGLQSVHQQARVKTLVEMVLHIVHFSLPSALYPLSVVAGCSLVDGFGLRYSTNRETETQSLGLNLVR